MLADHWVGRLIKDLETWEWEVSIRHMCAGQGSYVSAVCESKLQKFVRSKFLQH